MVTLAEVGGAQTYVARLVPALVDRYDVTVAAYGPGPLVAATEAAGARFVALEHVRRPVSPRDVLGLLELVRLFRLVRPDVVHLNSSKVGVLGRVAARIARVRAVVFTVHGWAFQASSGVEARAYLWAERLLRSLATVTVCVSQHDLDLGRRLGACREERAVVIQNGIDVDSTPRVPPQNERPVVISVGRLKQPKTFETLVEALARIDPAAFRAQIVGDGPERSRLESMLQGPVELLGERPDVAELLAAADVFVLSSASEGMPMSLLEAMAAGLPVVASAVGGIPELVGEAGLLVPPRDAEALARALERVLADPGLRARLGAAARARTADAFSSDRWLAAHLQLYERLVATGP